MDKITPVEAPSCVKKRHTKQCTCPLLNKLEERVEDRRKEVRGMKGNGILCLVYIQRMISTVGQGATRDQEENLKRVKIGRLLDETENRGGLELLMSGERYFMSSEQALSTVQ